MAGCGAPGGTMRIVELAPMRPPDISTHSAFASASAALRVKPAGRWIAEICGVPGIDAWVWLGPLTGSNYPDLLMAVHQMFGLCELLQPSRTLRSTLPRTAAVSLGSLLDSSHATTPVSAYTTIPSRAGPPGGSTRGQKGQKSGLAPPRVCKLQQWSCSPSCHTHCRSTTKSLTHRSGNKTS